MMRKQINAALMEKYEKIYAEGEENYFSKFDQGVDLSETNQSVLALADWRGKRVVDVGCGTGALLREIHARGAGLVTGIDYSNNAIELARTQAPSANASFVAGDIFELPPREHDVVISCGTIEHSDSPERFLEALAAWCRRDGTLIITCPHFINLRGFVWMALAILQEVPMSLTDLHFIHPWQMEQWCRRLSLRVAGFTTCDHDRGNGRQLVDDFGKRLRNALRDADIDNGRVPEYLEYLEALVAYLEQEDSYRLQGATAVYMIDRSGP